MDVIGLIKNLFGAAMEALGFARDRAAANNAPEMKANANAKTDAEIVDTTRDALAKKDIDEIRRLNS